MEKNSKGYPTGDVKHSDLIHRQIAYSEIYLKYPKKYPKKFSEYVIHHINGDKEDFSVRNLYLCSMEEHNVIHKEQKRVLKKFETKKQLDDFIKEWKRKTQSILNQTKTNPTISAHRSSMKFVSREEEKAIVKNHAKNQKRRREAVSKRNQMEEAMKEVKKRRKKRGKEEKKRRERKWIKEDKERRENIKNIWRIIIIISITFIVLFLSSIFSTVEKEAKSTLDTFQFDGNSYEIYASLSPRIVRMHENTMFFFMMNESNEEQKVVLYFNSNFEQTQTSTGTQTVLGQKRLEKAELHIDGEVVAIKKY